MPALNQETHLRIGLLEEEYTETQGKESNANDLEEDEFQNENIQRNQEISNDEGNVKINKEETEAVQANKHNNNKAGNQKKLNE